MFECVGQTTGNLNGRDRINDDNRVETKCEIL